MKDEAVTCLAAPYLGKERQNKSSAASLSAPAPGGGCEGLFGEEVA